jgi:hypothetical protein
VTEALLLSPSSLQQNKKQEGNDNKVVAKPKQNATEALLPLPSSLQQNQNIRPLLPSLSSLQ